MDYIDAIAIPGFREPISCWTHLLAAPVFAILGVVLVRRGRGQHWSRSLSLVVLVVSTVFLLSMSGIYHMLSPGTGRYVMRQLDIAGVFALIAGTATPVHAFLFTGIRRWLPLVIIWTAGVAGITFRSIYSESMPSGLGNAIFLLLGWGGAISAIMLWRRYGSNFIGPLLWGGIAYTIGVVVLSLGGPTLIQGVIGSHELWHVAVLVGLGLHWQFVFRIANGPPALIGSQYANCAA